jgi:hypothetical protein
MPPSVGEILSRRGLSQLTQGASERQDSAAPAQPQSRRHNAPTLSNSGARSGSGSSVRSGVETDSAQACDWLDWVRSGLPLELAPHVLRVLLKGGDAGGAERQLIVFTDSPAWCARLRYALLSLEERIRARDPAIRRLRAQVLRLA